MQTTTGAFVHRSAAPPARQPVPPPPVANRDDPTLTARRDLGNDFLQRSADCGDSRRTNESGCSGGCGGCALSRTVQPKMAVSAADGPDEREADAVADRVGGMARASGDVPA